MKYILVILIICFYFQQSYGETINDKLNLDSNYQYKLGFAFLNQKRQSPITGLNGFNGNGISFLGEHHLKNNVNVLADADLVTNSHNKFISLNPKMGYKFDFKDGLFSLMPLVDFVGSKEINGGNKSYIELGVGLGGIIKTQLSKLFSLSVTPILGIKTHYKSDKDESIDKKSTSYYRSISLDAELSPFKEDNYRIILGIKAVNDGKHTNDGEWGRDYYTRLSSVIYKVGLIKYF